MNVVFVGDYFVTTVTPPITFSDIENDDRVIDETAEWFESTYGVDLLRNTFDQYLED